MTMNRLSQQVRRVEVTEPVALIGRPDYVDAFEIELPEPDRDTPAAWVGAGLDDSPALAEWIASLLGVRDPPATSANPLPGWKIVQSDADLVHVERSIPLMRVTVVGRKVGSAGRRLTSVLHYERPAVARIVWAIVGIGHRRMVRRLLARSRGGAATSRAEDTSRAA